MNWAFGGISDDKFSGIANSFQTMKRLEVRDNPSYVKLQKACVADAAGWTFTDLPICFETVDSTSDVLAFWDTGKIYRKPWGTWAWVNCANVSAKILWCAEFDWYIYRATSASLFRIAIWSISSSWWAQSAWQTFSIGDSDMHPMFASEAYLFIWDWYVLASVGLSSVWAAAQLTLAKNDRIKWIQASWSLVNIYTRIGNQDAGRVYKWQLLANAPASKQTFKLQMRAIVQKDSVDYIIAWKTPVLCYFPYLRQILKRLPAVSSNPYAFTEHNNYILIGTTGGVYSRWSLSKDYPEVLVLDYTVSPGVGTETIWGIHSTFGDLYISRKNGSSYGVDKVAASTYVTSGEMVTRVYSGAQKFHYKTTDEFVLTFKPLTTGESIVVSVAPDLSSTFSLVTTIDNTVTTLGRFNIPFSKQFFFLETKIVLNWPGTTTPELYEAFYRFTEGW